MLCRYERTIFKSDKGFCIFSYSTEDQSVPKEAHNRSFYHDDKIHFTAIGYQNLMAPGRTRNMVFSYRSQCVRRLFLQIRLVSSHT